MRQQHCYKSIATIFFSSHFSNFIVTIFFPFHFGNFIATNQLPQFFFYNFRPKLLLNLSPHFRQLYCLKLLLNFSPTFRQFGCHNSPFFFFPPIFSNLVATIGFLLATPLRALHLAAGQQIRAARISVMRLSKFKPPITSLVFPLSYFLLEFRQRCCKIHSLSSIFQIILNSTYITHKLNFLQYSTKRLN